MNEATTTYIVLKELTGNPPPQFGQLQQFLAPHVNLLVAFWQVVWLVTAIAMIILLAREYMRPH